MKLTPVIPFEPVSTETIPQGEHWIAQIKWDGVRVLTYYDGENVKLYNRKVRERTFHYPELTTIQSYCTAHSVILDGEIIALGSDGKPSFHEVMRRDGIRRQERVKEIQKSVPITYMVFDVVHVNGKWINKRPLKERIEILSNIVMPNDHVQLVTVHHDADTLFEVVKQYQMEGIVMKDLNASYAFNGKDKRWQKKKNVQDLIAVIGGVTLRNGIVNAVLLGLYDDHGHLWYIGHAGTGKLTKAEWRELTERIKPLIAEKRTFVNQPERIKDAIWVKPVIAAKVQFMEWTNAKSLRQPSIQAFVDAAPEECKISHKFLS